MMKQNLKPYRHLTSNLGRSMIETLMVVSLYGLLTISIYKLVANIFTANENSTAITEISEMVDKLHRLYKWHDISASATGGTPTPLQYAMQEGIIESSPKCTPDAYDEEHKYTGNECKSSTAVPPIGYEIDLTTRYIKLTKNAGTISETACNAKNIQDCKLVFSLTLSGITEGQCRKLASADWGDSFYKVTSNATSSTPLSSNDENYPFREIDIKNLCLGATSITLSFF